MKSIANDGFRVSTLVVILLSCGLGGACVSELKRPECMLNPWGSPVFTEPQEPAVAQKEHEQVPLTNYQVAFALRDPAGNSVMLIPNQWKLLDATLVKYYGRCLFGRSLRGAKLLVRYSTVKGDSDLDDVRNEINMRYPGVTYRLPCITGGVVVSMSPWLEQSAVWGPVRGDIIGESSLEFVIGIADAERIEKLASDSLILAGYYVYQERVSGMAINQAFSLRKSEIRISEEE